MMIILHFFSEIKVFLFFFLFNVTYELGVDSSQHSSQHSSHNKTHYDSFSPGARGVHMYTIIKARIKTGVTYRLLEVLCIFKAVNLCPSSI